MCSSACQLPISGLLLRIFVSSWSLHILSASPSKYPFPLLFISSCFFAVLSLSSSNSYSFLNPMFLSLSSPLINSLLSLLKSHLYLLLLLISELSGLCGLRISWAWSYASRAHGYIFRFIQTFKILTFQVQGANGKLAFWAN